MSTIEERLSALEAQVAGITTPSYAEVVNLTMDNLVAQRTREDQMRDWLAGVAGGGPAGDGKYPVTDASGFTRQIPCPLQIASDSVLLPVVVLSGSNAYTLTAAHNGRFLVVTSLNNNQITVTLPGNVAPGWQCMLFQPGSGRVLYTINNSGILRSDQAFDRMRAQYSLAVAVCATRDTSNRSTIVLGGSLANA